MENEQSHSNVILKSGSSTLWCGLALALYVATFGFSGAFSFVFYILLFLAGWYSITHVWHSTGNLKTLTSKFSFFCMIAYWSINTSNEILASDDVQLLSYEDRYCGIAGVFQNIEAAPQGYKYDKRLTGSSGIDEALQEVKNTDQLLEKEMMVRYSKRSIEYSVIQFFFRDYIHYWYYTISDDERFLYQLRLSIHQIIINFATRTKDVEWVPFLTTRIVDDFATHLRIFRITRERLEKRSKQGTSNNLTADEAKIQEEIDLETMFFSVESEVEKGITRGPICLDDESEQQYLQDITEVLLYLLLPEKDFHNKTSRYFLREIVATSVILPTVNMICDPDYVNQTISWLCAKETTFTVDSFLTTIRLSDDIEDVEETKKKVDLEIAKLRSQDSQILDSNQSELSVKKQLNSLMYVRKLCITTIRRLKTGMTGDSINPVENDPEPDLMELLSPNQNIPKLSLREILEDNTALSYFIEFMGTYNAEHYIFFHLTIEGFRATAIQQLCILAEETNKAHNNKKGVGKGTSQDVDVKSQPTSENFEQLKQAAANIYDEYLSPKEKDISQDVDVKNQASPRIVLDDQMVRKIVKDIKSSEPSGAYFDAAHMAVYKILESPKYYGSFLQSTSYIKCLMELDLLNKSDDGTSDDDILSSVSSSSAHEKGTSQDVDVKNQTSRTSTFDDGPLLHEQWTPDVDLRYSALIGQAGVFKEDSKSYVNYTIHVCRTTSNGSRNWIVMRRYSDFHDLHMQLREKFPELVWLSLPAKKTFGNMEQEFIDKRRNQLEDYIQVDTTSQDASVVGITPLLDTTLLADHPGMFELVAGFLEQGEYYKGKSFMSRKIDHIVQPMQRSISNMKSAVKNKAHDVSRWSGDFGDRFSSNKTTEKDIESDVNIGKLSDAFDAEVDENIPLRILLMLMDEVFDLQQRNLWLRRRIVVLLRQIIKTIFGDGINRKIVDYVDFSTTSQQIVEYVKQFRDSYWPGGVLADAAPERPPDVKRRMRMVTKAKMIGSMPDELKRFLGTEVVREGASRVFDVFQHVNLNKRLFYVLFEAFLETTFPDNKFNEIFQKIHANKSRN